MLGREIAVELENAGIEYLGTDAEIDITDYPALKKVSQNTGIRWIINCAAYTAVDKAEEEEETAGKINVNGVRNLALIAKQIQAKIVHFSTDYVFDGDSCEPYDETDSPNPQTVYGKTKLEGENELQKITDNFFIFRISWLYGKYGNNFVNTMLRLMNEKNELRIVNDQYGAPTYTKTLAKNIIHLIKDDSNKFGIYHYSDEGKITWFDFTVKIYEIGLELAILNKTVNIIPIKTDEYPFKTKRPHYSLLNKMKVMKSLNFKVINWEINLLDYLKEFSITG